MGNKALKAMVILMFFVTGCGFDSRADTPSVGSSPDINDVFKMGDFRSIVIKVPKEGFAGAPPSHRAYRSRKKIPSSDSDYEFKYVRITIIEKIELKNVTRIAFQLEETDSNGIIVPYYRHKEHDEATGVHRPLYYAYLDIGPNSCRMTGTARPRSNASSEELALDTIGTIRGGVLFPLELTCPPVLISHENFKDNSWIVKERGGVVFTEAANLSEPNYMRIKASLMREVTPDTQTKKENIRYYSPYDRTINTQEQPGTIPVLISRNETQIWDKPDDWLWLEMERTDEDGHIVMHCRKLKMDKDIKDSLVSIEFITNSGERQEKTSPANPPVDVNSVDCVLNGLRKAASILKSFQCKVEYLFSQPVLDSKTLRTGNLYYKRLNGGSNLRIEFDTLTQDDGPRQNYKECYIFDGQWLTHIDYQIKQVQKRQLAEANEPIDAFELAKRNFPIIGFGKAEDLKKDFDVNLIDEPNDQIHLLMKVRPDSRYKDDYASVDAWIDTAKTGLPEKVTAVSTNGDIYEIRFVGPKVNEPIDEKVFEIAIPDGFGSTISPLEGGRPEIIPLKKN